MKKDMIIIACCIHFYKKQDEKKRTHFYQEYANILERLQEALEADISLYRDLYDLMRKLVEYMLKKQVKLKEGVEHVMGGKVLPLPSDVLREAENKGKIAGKIEGKISSLYLLPERNSSKIWMSIPLPIY